MTRRAALLLAFQPAPPPPITLAEVVRSMETAVPNTLQPRWMRTAAGVRQAGVLIRDALRACNHNWRAE